jgi:tetratricopeptide (TPR) repeat protein
MTWTAAALLACVLSLQDAKKPDDVLQRKDGGILVGRVLKLEAEAVEILVNGEKEPRRLALRDLNPYTVYRLKLDRADKGNAQARLDLGEYCMTQGLYSQATREFEEAARLDKGLEDKARKRREEAHTEEGRSRFEEAKRLATEQKYEDSNKICQMLIEKFGDTAYADEARKLVAKVAEDVAKANEAKKAQLQEKKDLKAQAKEQLQEKQEKDLLGRSVDLVEEAQKLWIEGLDSEAKNLTRADKAWKGAETALIQAKRNLEVLLKSNDVETLRKAKELDVAADGVLVKTYYRLGRMWAVELSYPTALEWLNKAMRIPHDAQTDHLINEVLLTISQLKMRERAAGRGY